MSFVHNMPIYEKWGWYLTVKTGGLNGFRIPDTLLHLKMCEFTVKFYEKLSIGSSNMGILQV